MSSRPRPRAVSFFDIIHILCLTSNILSTELLLLLILTSIGKIAAFENSEKWAAHCDRMNDMFMTTPFLERKEDPSSRMKKKKKQKQKTTDGSAEEEGTTRIPKKSLLKSVTW